MRRSDRLFQIVTFLQGRRRAVTAARIAEEFGVCERTIYRDIADLSKTGVPVVGEAGVGYMLDSQYHLPPIMFDTEEIEALLLGIAMVDSWTDKPMAAAARRALSKVRSVLGKKGQEVLSETTLFAPPSASLVPWTVDFTEIKSAIRGKRKLSLVYTNEKRAKSKRTVRPLALLFFGPVWVLLAWCEARRDFRNFRLDRMSSALPTGDGFADERGKRVSDFMAAEGHQPHLQ
jgi:predicted DNA-binding transcriptional regulator YafY